MDQTQVTELPSRSLFLLKHLSSLKRDSLKFKNYLITLLHGVAFLFPSSFHPPFLSSFHSFFPVSVPVILAHGISLESSNKILNICFIVVCVYICVCVFISSNPFLNLFLIKIQFTSKKEKNRNETTHLSQIYTGKIKTKPLLWDHLSHPSRIKHNLHVY